MSGVPFAVDLKTGPRSLMCALHEITSIRFDGLRCARLGGRIFIRPYEGIRYQHNLSITLTVEIARVISNLDGNFLFRTNGKGV